MTKLGAAWPSLRRGSLGRKGLGEEEGRPGMCGHGHIGPQVSFPSKGSPSTQRPGCSVLVTVHQACQASTSTSTEHCRCPTSGMTTKFPHLISSPRLNLRACEPELAARGRNAGRAGGERSTAPPPGQEALGECEGAAAG